MMRSIQRQLGLAIAITTVLLSMQGVPAGGTVTAAPMKFGMDPAAVPVLTKAGIAPDYAQLWAGVWLQRSGWDGFDRQLDSFSASGITPVIQFYYWGNDISRTCVENGCWSASQQVWKDKAGWQRLADGLATNLKGHMKGHAAVVVLETEFNKNGVQDYEPFDGYLAAKATGFKNAYTATQVVLGFGNWGNWQWSVFDRAAAASTWVGVQGMRASTRDSTAAYTGLASSLLAAAQKLSQTFHKGVLLTDIALSSYPEPSWLATQRTAVQNLMDRRSELRAAGVVGVVYRSLYDTPNADTSDWYGQAERHFGLAWPGNGTWKPGMTAWLNGIKAERAAASTAAVEAERFAEKTTGGWVASSTASGGAYWNLWSNGHIAQTWTLAGGTYEIRVRGQGTLLDNVAPLMTVSVDSKEIFRGAVAPGGFRDYVVRGTFAGGAHSVRVSFLNDAPTSTQDRNLLLDWVSVLRVA